MPSKGEMPVELHAYAKVNLTLEVLGPRGDGYHEIGSVLQSIALADRLTLEPAAGLELDCSIPGLEGESNLALRAARVLKEATQCLQGARIRLEKGIPVGAGLGGGSSDAAATLRGLNALWGLNLPQDALVALAARLGSDVPFFLVGGTALAQGRGEVITPLPHLPPTWLVVLRPPLELPEKTAHLYSLLREEHYTDGGITRRLVEALGNNQFSPEMLFNVFERVAPLAFPGIEEYRQAFQRAGASYLRMSGTGPTLYTLAAGEKEGAEMAKRLRDKGYQACLTNTMPGQGGNSLL